MIAAWRQPFNQKGNTSILVEVWKSQIHVWKSRVHVWKSRIHIWKSRILVLLSRNGSVMLFACGGLRRRPFGCPIERWQWISAGLLLSPDVFCLLNNKSKTLQKTSSRTGPRIDGFPWSDLFSAQNFHSFLFKQSVFFQIWFNNWQIRNFQFVSNP